MLLKSLGKLSAIILLKNFWKNECHYFTQKPLENFTQKLLES